MAETCYFPLCAAGQADDRLHSDSAEMAGLSVLCWYTTADQ